MPIQSTDLKCYKAVVNNDTSSNGGRMSSVEAVSGTSNSFWPNISETQRRLGSTQYRKLFWKVGNSEGLALTNVKHGLMKPTPGSDRIYLFAGTQVDTQADITSPTLYGTGKLDANVTTGATSITVLVEHGATVIFRDGDLIRISDKQTLTGTGNEEWATIDVAPSVTGDVVTITLVSALQNGYSATNTYVSSIIQTPIIKATVGELVVTSAGGLFDINQVVPNAIGAVEQTLTFTFSSSTAFTCVGDTIGQIGVGGINATFAPLSVGNGVPYFSIPGSAWTGNFVSGDKVVFKTHPASVAIWEKRIVPVNAASIAQQSRDVFMIGESE